MFFSVLMCCYQYDDFIDDAIKSVLRQDYDGKFEFIIVANNCSDDFYEYLKKITKEFEFVKIFRIKIGQLAFALNYGIEEASGDYIVRFDADDVCCLDRLKVTEKIIEENNYPDLIAGNAFYIDENGNIVGASNVNNDWNKKIYVCSPFIHPAIAINKNFLIKNKGYSGGLQSEDYDLWLRIFRSKKYRVVVTSNKLIYYRFNEKQVRGSILGSAEGVGLQLREVILKPSFCRFYGMVKRLLCILKGKKEVKGLS
jgi:hypothetical protein